MPIINSTESYVYNFSEKIDLRLSAQIITKRKFVCPTHSEPKQTEMSEFGAQKGLLQGPARKTGGSYSNYPELPAGFQKSILKAR